MKDESAKWVVALRSNPDTLGAKVDTPLGGCAFPPGAPLWPLPSDEKHCQQLLGRLAPPHVREVFRAFRKRALTAGSAAAERGLGRAAGSTNSTPPTSAPAPGTAAAAGLRAPPGHAPKRKIAPSFAPPQRAPGGPASSASARPSKSTRTVAFPQAPLRLRSQAPQDPRPPLPPPHQRPRLHPPPPLLPTPQNPGSSSTAQPQTDGPPLLPRTDPPLFAARQALKAQLPYGFILLFSEVRNPCISALSKSPWSSAPR